MIFGSVWWRRWRRAAVAGLSLRPLALIGEVGALSEYIKLNYLSKVQAYVDTLAEQNDYPYHHFRGERDYMLVDQI